MESTAWILAALGIVATAVALALWRGEKARTLGAQNSLERLREEAHEKVSREERVAQKKRGNADELQELRRRLEKTKKRAFEAAERLKPTESRIEELERQIAEREREHVSQKDALDTANARLNALTSERAALVDRVRVLEEAPNPEPPPAENDHRELEEATRRVKTLERELREAKQEGARYRQRSRTHQRLYMVIHGELELAKDRIREFQGLPPSQRPGPALVDLSDDTPSDPSGESTTGS